MTILEQCIERQKERRKYLIEGNGFDSFSLDCGNSRYLYHALLEGKTFGLYPNDIDMVVRSFDSVENFLVDAPSDTIRMIGDDASLSFIRIKGQGCDGYLISLNVDLNERSCDYFTFRKSKLDPVLNMPLVERLQEFGIDIYDGRGHIDYMKLMCDLVKHREIKVEEVTSLDNNVLYDFYRWNTLNSDSKTLKRLDDETPEYEKRFSISKCPIFPMKRIFEKLDDEGVVYVRGNNHKLNDVLTNYFLKDKLKEGKTILVARKSEDQVERLSKKFKSTGYANIIPDHYFGDPGFNLVDEARRMLTSTDSTFEGLGLIYKRNWESELTKFMRSDRNVNSVILKTGEDTLTGVNKFSKYHKSRTNSVPLDISRYTLSDFKKDKDFMSFFKSAIYINKGKMSKYPLYSLSAYGTKELFQTMRSSLNVTWNHLDDLQSKISEFGVRDWGMGSVSSIGDLESILNKLKVILQYDGFSDVFFDISKNPNSMALSMTLANLSERRDSLFETICEYVSDLSKIDEPLDEYLRLAKSKNLFDRNRGHSLLSNTLRDKRDLPDFMVTLDKYESCLEEFKSKVKESESMFGLILYSEDGPRKAMEALRFVDEYSRLVEDDERCDRMSNTFVGRIFKDYDFREGLRDKAKDLENIIMEIDEDFAGLKDFFNCSFHERTLSFSSLKQDLKGKEEVGYIEYEQYCEFLNRIKNCSSTMKEAFLTFDAVNEPIDNFENDYWYSLYKSLAVEKESVGVSSHMKAAMALCCYEPYKIDDDGLEISKMVKEKVMDYWTDDGEVVRLKDSYRYGGTIYPYNALNHYSKFAKMVSPLQISTARMLSLSDIGYDYVYIENPEDFDDDELYLLLSKGGKALVVSNTEDQRFSGYGKYVLDEGSLYRDYLRFENLSDEFVDEMAYGFEENGLELLNMDESGSAMYFSYRDEDGTLHAVVPNCLIGDVESVKVKVILNSLLLYIGKEPLVIVPSMTLMIDPKRAIEIALENSKID